jgi:hypothetical protein
LSLETWALDFWLRPCVVEFRSSARLSFRPLRKRILSVRFGSVFKRKWKRSAQLVWWRNFYLIFWTQYWNVLKWNIEFLLFLLTKIVYLFFLVIFFFFKGLLLFVVVLGVIIFLSVWALSLFVLFILLSGEREKNSEESRRRVSESIILEKEATWIFDEWYLKRNFCWWILWRFVTIVEWKESSSGWSDFERRPIDDLIRCRRQRWSPFLSV